MAGTGKLWVDEWSDQSRAGSHLVERWGHVWDRLERPVVAEWQLHDDLARVLAGTLVVANEETDLWRLVVAEGEPPHPPLLLDSDLASSTC